MTPLFDTITLSMIKRLTLCLLLTCLYVPCFSQERFVVRGRILDAESAPVPYCSVSILESRDSTILGGAVSDTKGDRKSTRLNSSHANESRMPSSA